MIRNWSEIGHEIENRIQETGDETWFQFDSHTGDGTAILIFDGQIHGTVVFIPAEIRMLTEELIQLGIKRLKKANTE